MQPDPQTPTAGRIQAGAIVERVKAILTAPRSEWPVIAAEPASVAGLYTGYIMPLAAIPAVFGFIKGSLIGYSLFGATVTTSIGAGLTSMVLGYVLGLVMLYVVAMIVNALAPTFGGEKHQVQALKAVGYAWTAAWVAGIAVILPWLGGLIALAGGIYSIYLLYLGLPHTMKCPPERATMYTVVTAILAIVMSLVLGAVLAGIGGAGALTAGAIGSSGGGIPGLAGNSRGNVKVDSSSALGQLAEMGRRGAEAARQAEQAHAAGDTEAQGRALGAMLGAVTGGTDADGEPVEAVAPDALRALLPESLGDRRRTSVSGGRGGALGMQMSEARAEYAAEDGAGRISVEIKDMAAVSGMMAMAGAFGGMIEQSSETDSGYERTYSRDGKWITEEWDSSRNRGKYAVMVGNRFQIEASGQADSINELRQLVEQLDRQVVALQ